MSGPTLRALRARLTLWYGATFAVILALLGIGLFAAIHTQITAQLRRSLKESTAALIRAEHTREMEAAGASGAVMDAVDELHIPGHQLFLFDSNAHLLTPMQAPAAICAGAAVAIRDGRFEGIDHQAAPATSGQEEGERRFYAERFTSGSGAYMVAVASADVVELQERYSSLIVSFGLAALAALVLVGAGGWVLVRQSTTPIERNIAQMRRFMADAAHELRTPVTVVRSRAEVALQQPRDTEGYLVALRGIEAEGMRMGRLVDDLLILARADAGERPVDRIRVFLDDLVLDAAEAASAMAKTRGITVDLDQYEETVVLGDGALLRQLIMILLDNAVKFTSANGRVVIQVNLREGVPTVVVRDTGSGITPEQLPHIFERFYRGDEARTSHLDEGQARGAGLGLSIAKWICDVHGATLQVESAIGVGTTVVVHFLRAPEV